MTEALRDYLEERFGRSARATGRATSRSAWRARPTSESGCAGGCATDGDCARPCSGRTSTGCRWSSSTTRWRRTWRPTPREAALHDQLHGRCSRPKLRYNVGDEGRLLLLPRGCRPAPARAGPERARRLEAGGAVLLLFAAATARSPTWVPTSTRRTWSTACTRTTRWPRSSRASASRCEEHGGPGVAPVVNLQLRDGALRRRASGRGLADGAAKGSCAHLARGQPRLRGVARRRPVGGGRAGAACTTSGTGPFAGTNTEIKNVYLVEGAAHEDHRLLGGAAAGAGRGHVHRRHPVPRRRGRGHRSPPMARDGRAR